jgi:deoxyxylulose-5-phosphate synthase
VSEALNAKGVEVEFLHMGIPDSFVEHGAVTRLLQDVGLEPSAVVESVVNRWPELKRLRAVRGI